MNKYEAMVIFSDEVKDAVLEEAIGRVRAEIKKLGGEVDSTTRLGKRAFARVMKKKEAGTYVLITFSMDGSQVGPLQARLKLNEEVFRIQVVCAMPRPERPAKLKEEVAHGLA